MTDNMKSRVISSFRLFREATRSNVLIDPFSGRSEKVIELIYGFDGSRIIRANSFRKAYQHYCEYYHKYDRLISKKSFLYG